jgi:hypothetical protein
MNTELMTYCADNGLLSNPFDTDTDDSTEAARTKLCSHKDSECNLRKAPMDQKELLNAVP